MFPILFAADEPGKNWFSSAFEWLFENLKGLFDWALTTIYNIVLEVAEFVFEQLVNLFIYALNLFPDADFSKFENNIDAFLKILASLDRLVPISDAFDCILFLIAYYTVYTIIYLVIKLIPSVG
ncbi:MAG: hypothetical protein IJY15_03185 [Thermoguttaceae bacterium]|nr:hypothetical protein [Thermoguttaceae bacterium]